MKFRGFYAFSPGLTFFNFFRIKEQQTLELLLARDQKGLRDLYADYGQAVYGVISRIVKQDGLAEEVLQQTMLKAWNGIGSYDPDKSALFTWLAAIARNTAIDAVRLKRYQNQQKTDSFDPHVHDSGTHYDEAAALDVQKLTKNLDEKYRFVLDKAYLEGYSQAEIADEFNLPLGTVKTRLRKAIAILRDQLRSEKSLFIGILTTLAALVGAIYFFSTFG